MAGTRRAAAVVAAGLMITSLGACSDSRRAELDAVAASRAREANQAVLLALPDLPGRSFEAYHEVGPPPGGEGLMAEAIYAAPPAMTPPQIVDFFEEAMPDWQPICRQDRPTRSATTLRRDDAWLVVSAGEYGFDGPATPTAGFTVAVNALDGELMQRDHTSRQTCD